MAGKISFHFEGKHIHFYEQILPLFSKAGAVGCIVIEPDSDSAMIRTALEMQASGWEIISRLTDSPDKLVGQGLKIRQAVARPGDDGHVSHAEIQKLYDAVFTGEVGAGTLPTDELTVPRPVNTYRLNRVCANGKKVDELKEYIDHVSKNDAWMVLCFTAQNDCAELWYIAELLSYCNEKEVAVVTSSSAVDGEKCVTKIIREGYDGKKCYVHTRSAVFKNRIIMTSQLLDVSGSDCFDCLEVNCSDDGGRTWSGFVKNSCFNPKYYDDLRTVCSDMTPLYHKKTGKFIVTGLTIDYLRDGIRPVDDLRRAMEVSYAVFSESDGKFTEAKYLEKLSSRFSDCGSGCSQCYELENGDIIVPIAFREPILGGKAKSRVSVMRCSFDGETLRCKEVGRDLVVSDEVRGLCEASVIFCAGRYYLTIRGNGYGYVSAGEDGINFTDPIRWCWDDGEILPTYNTQSHWLTLGDRLYLVYTRKNGKNNHVFRNRAPLYCAEVNKDDLTVIRDTEFVVVPERGTRLGNFGVCQIDENRALITASEWMQPATCVEYGSTNAVWMTEVRNV